MRDLMHYISKVEDTGVSTRGGEYFIEKEEGWHKISSNKLKGYQKGYKAWLIEKRKEDLGKSLMVLADRKQEEAERLILGYKATPKQIERYKDKYERAKEGEFDKAMNAVIIQKFEDTRSYIRRITDTIEEYRSLIGDMLKAGELDKAEKAIEIAQAFSLNTKKKDVTKVLGEL